MSDTTDSDMTARFHPRSIVVKYAERDLHRMIGNWLVKHKLTPAEEIKLLTQVPARFVVNGMNVEIMKERDALD